MEVSFATEREIDEWMRFEKSAQEFFPELKTDELLLAHRETVLDFMAKKQAIYAQNEGKIAGVALFSKEENKICLLAVSPESRKQGVGSMLLKKALSELDESKDIFVSTFRENDEKGKAPRALYQKFGFVQGEMTLRSGYPNQIFVLRAK